MDERERLLYVELPIIISKIMKFDSVPVVSINRLNKTGDEIKKISTAEVDSAIETIKKLI